MKVELHRHAGVHEVYIAGTNLCIGMFHESRHGVEAYDADQEPVGIFPNQADAIAYLHSATTEDADDRTT